MKAQKKLFMWYKVKKLYEQDGLNKSQIAREVDIASAPVTRRCTKHNRCCGSAAREPGMNDYMFSTNNYARNCVDCTNISVL
jgi:hypothetical protein